MLLLHLERYEQAASAAGKTDVARAAAELVAELVSLPEQHLRLRIRNDGLIVPERGYTLDQATRLIAFDPKPRRK